MQGLTLRQNQHGQWGNIFGIFQLKRLPEGTLWQSKLAMENHPLSLDEVTVQQGQFSSSDFSSLRSWPCFWENEQSIAIHWPLGKTPPVQTIPHQSHLVQVPEIQSMIPSPDSLARHVLACHLRTLKKGPLRANSSTSGKSRWILGGTTLW